MSMVAVSAFLSMPYTTLLPVFAKNVLHESAKPLIGLVCGGTPVSLQCQSPDALTFGLLQAASGIGAVLGALIVASMPKGAGEAAGSPWATWCSPPLSSSWRRLARSR